MWGKHFKNDQPSDLCVEPNLIIQAYDRLAIMYIQ
jgi:hypothetical protein